MEKSVAIAGFQVESFTARTESGWAGFAHVLREGRVLERLSTSAVASQRQALDQATEEARQRVLRRILGEFICPQK